MRVMRFSWPWRCSLRQIVGTFAPITQVGGQLTAMMNDVAHRESRNATAGS
jgi:hypothetical protein